MIGTTRVTARKSSSTIALRSTAFTALVALFAPIALLGSGAAAAQGRPAIVQNVDERGREPYNLAVEFDQSSCSFNCSNFVTLGTGPGPRVVLFDAPAVPVGKRLVVEWISAEVPSNNSVNSISFQRSPILSNQRAKWQYHGPFYNVVVGGTGLYGMSSGAFFTYEPSESPHIRVRLGDASSFFASISIGGYLIDAP